MTLNKKILISVGVALLTIVIVITCLSGIAFYRFVVAYGITGAALIAVGLVDHVQFVLLAGNSARWTCRDACCTAGTFVVNSVGYQGLAYSRRAFLVVNMCQVLLAEIPHSAQEWIRARLPQTA